MSLRILGGQWKNRLIKTPKGAQTRPTSALVRKALFDICREIVEGAQILDLFAGSGAVGLEALSRGAKRATFIDSHKEAIACLHSNVHLFGVERQTDIILGDLPKALKKIQKKPYQLIYIDPPYGYKHHEILLKELLEQELIAPEALLFIEESGTLNLEIPPLKLIQIRHYGKTHLHQFTWY